MNSAELKLLLFRIIDQQEDQILKEIYELLTQKLEAIIPSKTEDEIDRAYAEMAADEEREAKAVAF